MPLKERNLLNKKNLQIGLIQWVKHVKKMILPILKFNSVARCIFDIKCGVGFSLTCAPVKSRIGKETNVEKIEESDISFMRLFIIYFFCVLWNSRKFLHNSDLLRSVLIVILGIDTTVVTVDHCDKIEKHYWLTFRVVWCLTVGAVIMPYSKVKTTFDAYTAIVRRFKILRFEKYLSNSDSCFHDDSADSRAGLAVDLGLGQIPKN